MNIVNGMYETSPEPKKRIVGNSKIRLHSPKDGAVDLALFILIRAVMDYSSFVRYGIFVDGKLNEEMFNKLYSKERNKNPRLVSGIRTKAEVLDVLRFFTDGRFERIIEAAGLDIDTDGLVKRMNSKLLVDNAAKMFEDMMEK